MSSTSKSGEGWEAHAAMAMEENNHNSNSIVNITASRDNVVLILDSGTQYTHLITRRIWQLAVCCVCLSSTSTPCACGPPSSHYHAVCVSRALWGVASCHDLIQFFVVFPVRFFFLNAVIWQNTEGSRHGPLGDISKANRSSRLTRAILLP